MEAKCKFFWTRLPIDGGSSEWEFFPFATLCTSPPVYVIFFFGRSEEAKNSLPFYQTLNWVFPKNVLFYMNFVPLYYFCVLRCTNEVKSNGSWNSTWTEAEKDFFSRASFPPLSHSSIKFFSLFFLPLLDWVGIAWILPSCVWGESMSPSLSPGFGAFPPFQSRPQR